MRSGKTVSLIEFDKASRVTIAAAAFIASSLLSLICAICYNIWLYDFERGKAAAPALLLGFYIAVMLITCLSLVLIIKNAFAVSTTARVRLIGTLSSIGATYRQIVSMLIGRALSLSFAPILAGSAAGVGLAYLFILYANTITVDPANFGYDIRVALIAVVSAFATVTVSAWLPARKAGKTSPLEAIRFVGEPSLKKRGRSRIMAALFGFEGELAARSMKARARSLRACYISLTLSLAAFSLFACFITLSSISTQYTYFERYKDKWDIMFEIRSSMPDKDTLREISGIDRVESAVAYEKSRVSAKLKDGEFSEVPIILMDEAGFNEYLERLGAPDGDGCVIINRVWKSGGYKRKVYENFMDESARDILLENGARLPVICYTRDEPVLREELDDFTATIVAPNGDYGQISAKESYIRVLTREDGDIKRIQSAIDRILGERYDATGENRADEKLENERTLNGYMLFIGAFCAILALIGVANAFACALSVTTLRRREFARYISIGVTRKGIAKILAAEAFGTVAKPFIAALFLASAFIVFACDASDIEISAFMAKAPIAPLAALFLFIAASVFAAYAIGARGVFKCDMPQTLKDDGMI